VALLAPSNATNAFPVVNQLEQTGCTAKEAAALLKALEGVIASSHDNLLGVAVKREDHERVRGVSSKPRSGLTAWLVQSQYQAKVEFGKLKSELALVAKQDFGLLRGESDRCLSEVESLRQRLKEETTRTTAGVRLDLSFERGRIREELGARDIRIREIDGRLDSELAALRVNNAAIKVCIQPLRP
jgi:hypothetical protein